MNFLVPAETHKKNEKMKKYLIFTGTLGWLKITVAGLVPEMPGSRKMFDKTTATDFGISDSENNHHCQSQVTTDYWDSSRMELWQVKHLPRCINKQYT